MTTTEPTLHQLAGRVAEQLVADALRQMVQHGADIVVTVSAQTPALPAPKQKLLPAPKRKYTKRATKKAKTVARKKRPAPGSWEAKVAAVNSIGAGVDDPIHAIGDRVVAVLEAKGPLGPGHLAKAARLGVTGPAATRLLVKLADAGRIVRQGNGRASVVTLPGATPAPARTTAGKACRCTHEQKHHVEYSGVCTARGCSCSSFTAA